MAVEEVLPVAYSSCNQVEVIFALKETEDILGLKETEDIFELN